MSNNSGRPQKMQNNVVVAVQPAKPGPLEVSTCHDKGRKLFGERARIRRWDESVFQWKEIGKGELKIIKHSGSDGIRLSHEQEGHQDAMIQMKGQVLMQRKENMTAKGHQNAMIQRKSQVLMHRNENMAAKGHQDAMIQTKCQKLKERNENMAAKGHQDAMIRIKSQVVMHRNENMAAKGHQDSMIENKRLQQRNGNVIANSHQNSMTDRNDQVLRVGKENLQPIGHQGAIIGRQGHVLKENNQNILAKVHQEAMLERKGQVFKGNQNFIANPKAKTVTFDYPLTPELASSVVVRAKDAVIWKSSLTEHYECQFQTNDIRTKFQHKVHECAMFLQKHQQPSNVVTKRAPTSDHINRLPDEILVRIFAHFNHYDLCSNIAVVCKRWCKLSRDPALWHELSIHQMSCMTVVQARLVLGWASQLKELNISSKMLSADAVVNIAWQRCGNLTSLALIGCTPITTSTIRQLAGFFPKLERLVLRKMTVKAVSTADAFILMASLRELVLFEVKVSDWCVVDMCTRSPGLVHVDLRYTSDQIRPLVLKALLDNAPQLGTLAVPGLSETEAKLSHLTVLKIGKRTNDEHMYEVDVEHYFSSALRLPLLMRLEMINCRLSSSAIQSITDNCKNLRYLLLDRCSGVDESAVETVVTGLPCLEQLHLSDVFLTGVCFRTCPPNLPRIQVINIAGCNGTQTASAFRRLREWKPQLVITY